MSDEVVDLLVVVIIVLNGLRIDGDTVIGRDGLERRGEGVEGSAIDGYRVRCEEIDAEGLGGLSHALDQRSQCFGAEIAAGDEGESTGSGDGSGELGCCRSACHRSSDDGQISGLEGDRRHRCVLLARAS